MREVLIVGGGIAGSVAGMALREAGFAVTVCEAHPTGADEVGSWLVLQANGMDALAAIGAHHVVTRTGFPTRTMRFVDTCTRYRISVSESTASEELSPVLSRTSCRYGRTICSRFIDSRYADANDTTAGRNRNSLPRFAA